MPPSSYEKEILQLREEVNANVIVDPLHWFNLAGLFRLQEGDNPLGSGEENKISLPQFPASFCGRFDLKNGSVTFLPAADVAFTSSKADAKSRVLATDQEADPDLISIGPLTMKIIVRGSATLVRVWDADSATKMTFTGFKYFPVDEKYAIKAKYIGYDPPRVVTRLDMIGTASEGRFLGRAEFKFGDVECTLEAEEDGEQLLFHFTDETRKSTTYGGGRKFRIPRTEADEITLDFNIAENWPCAYTPFATCPVVPQENRLPVRIEAGEKKYFDY